MKSERPHFLRRFDLRRFTARIREESSLCREETSLYREGRAGLFQIDGCNALQLQPEEEHPSHRRAVVSSPGAISPSKLLQSESEEERRRFRRRTSNVQCRISADRRNTRRISTDRRNARRISAESRLAGHAVSDSRNADDPDRIPSDIPRIRGNSDRFRSNYLIFAFRIENCGTNNTL